MAFVASMALATPRPALAPRRVLGARSSRFCAAPPQAAAALLASARSAPRAITRRHGAVAYTEWVLDAPGCNPYREVEEVLAENGGGAKGMDRHVTRRALKVADDCAGGVVHDVPADLKRINTAVPMDLSAMMKQAGKQHVIVGDPESFKAAFEEGTAEVKLPADVEGSDAPPRLDYDVTEFTKERALVAFSTDKLGNLYVMDLPGEHTLKVDSMGMGKGHKMRLWPGWTVDLSGAGKELYYQVYRDMHAHA